MEGSFKNRVDKIFGSLGVHAPSSTGSSPALWSLSGEEVERRQWNRSKDDLRKESGKDFEPEPVDWRSQLESDLQDLSGDEEEEEEDEGTDDGEEKKRRRGEGPGAKRTSTEDFDVASNIGRDCTLDYEEEEDAYDKVAVGMEQTGDYLYMKHARSYDYGIDEINTYGELPDSFKTAARDPRANHIAAKIRLREDAETSGDLETLQLSDNSVATNVEIDDLREGYLGDDIPKPILKRKENSMDSKSEKRVRFSVDPDHSSESKEEQSVGAILAPEQCTGDVVAAPTQAPDPSRFAYAVPDYVKNPSKYTRYSLDTTEDLDNRSNQKAYAELFQYLRGADSSAPEDNSVDIPKSVTFNPRKKQGEDSSLKSSGSMRHTPDSDHKNTSWSIGVSAEDEQDTEVSVMDEDEPVAGVANDSSLHKPGRQYRSRTKTHVDDN